MQGQQPSSVVSPAQSSSPSVDQPMISAVPDYNPGTYEELHRKCRDVFPMCFEGARAMLQKALSSHFQLSHTISISPANTGYRFGATYIGKKAFGENEMYPVLLGDTDAAGNTSATLIHQFGDKWRLKLQGQVQEGKFVAAQGQLDYRGRLTTNSLTLANTNLIAESGVIVAQTLRRITPKFDLGAELVYQYGKQVPGGQLSVMSYAARYTGQNFVASGTFSSSGIHLCYYHKQVENLAFGVEFESNFRVQEAVTTFAYQADIPEEGVTMRASFDTNWTVGGVFEKKLGANLPFTLAISGMLNHVKAQGKFGIGFIVG